ncbi:sentrin-specific protease 6 veloren isoform X2 [Musca autumnalis]|uniref:sentrin-specific protease 6 veloren isoform X2 n=1 Tax=Musca autumnalis TaxID=221902 RepID=UPI003CE767CA
MAHYYIQSLDDNIKLYTTDVQVVHVAGDDVGQIVMDDSSQILLQNDGGPQQVVYQTQATPTQYQPPQPGQTYTILGDDINQTQTQQVHQQQPQQQAPQQQQQAPPPQHQQQQILMHQQQQQTQQQHQVIDHQQHQMQTTYLQADPQQQHMQATQEHQMQHVQAAAAQQQQQPPPQIYYTTEQLVHQQQQQQQQQQKKVYIQQQPPPPQTMQQQYQPHPQQQTHQQMMHQQPPPPPQQQQQQQQHILQSPQHQQVQVQHQVSPGNQQAQQQPQIIYRMQPQTLQTTQQQLQQQTQLLGNTQLIVQQPSGQQVLIQQSSQQQELIMRQQPRVVYGNRINFTPQQQPQQQQQQVIMQQSQPHQQQQHIQIQTNAMHHNPTGHMVQQARVVPQQHQQQVQQQHTPPPQQQMQQNVVYHQIQVQNNQMAKQTMQQNAVVHQQQQQQQQQHMQQLQQQQHPQQQVQMVAPLSNPNGTTIIRTAGVRGGKIARGGALIARMPGMGPGVARSVFNTAGTIGGGGGQILRTPRPRCSTTAGTTTRGRGGRGARGAAAAALAAGRGVQLGMNSNAQLQGKLVSPNVRQVFRTQHQLSDGSVQQQLHLVQTHARAPGAVTRFRSPVVGQQVQHQQTQQHATSQSSPPSSTNTTATGATSTSTTGNFDLDLEDSIQAVFVKKDGQKQNVPASAPNAAVASGGTAPQNTTTTNIAGAAAGTTLTSYYAKTSNSDDDDTRLIRTQNGTCMTLAEFKKRNANAAVAPQAVQGANSASCIKPLQQTPAGAKITLPAAGGQALHTVPVARVAPQKHIVPKEQLGNAVPANTTASPLQNRPPAGSSVYQTSHNNYEIQTQHVLQNRAGQQMAEKDRNSAKMLVILVSGEQRLITFTLPRESCTVQDLLEQVGVPFDDNTTIQCVENPGANIDFVVTVGFSVQESASELISRAEQSLQISRQQESLQQSATGQTNNAQAQQEQSSGAANAVATTGANSNVATTTASSALSSVSASSSSSPAPSDSSNKEQSTPTSKVSTAGSKTPQDDSSGSSSQRKLIQGFYAICQSCGFSGYDHSKCERCKRVFLEPPKKIPIKQANNAAASGNFGNLSASGSESSFSPNTTGPGDKKPRHHSETNPSQRGKSSASYNPNGPSTRGRGGSQGGRGRGTRSGRRAAEIEPVILTLSSDEEDDESSNKGTSNMAHFAKSQSNSSPASLMSSYKPLSFEPNIPESDETIIYSDFKRGDITDLANCSDKLSCTLPCKYIRLGTYCFEPPEQVVITSKGVRIVAPLESNPSETFPLHIHKQEVVKVIAHFSKTTDSMLCFYTLRTCAQYIRTSLKMPDITQPLDGVTYFSPNGPYQMRKIILQFQTISDQAKSVIRSIWDFLDEISDTDAQDLLQRAAESDRKVNINKNNSESVPTTTQLQPNEIRQLLIYPQGKGGIAINTEDYMCLATDQYLNDIIIDFYLKWVHENIIPDAQKERTHIFSTFFYKRLTTLTRHINHDKDVKQTAAQKRHARVQNWTKNVNLFEKDYIIIPINEQSHWFLAIICFPKLKGPVTFDTNVPVELQPIKKTKGKKVSLQIGNTTITPLSKRDSSNVLSEICGVGDDDSERDEAEGDDSDLASEDSDFDNSNSTTPSNSQPAVPVATSAPTNTSTHQPIKQPLILIFDSLAGASRSRVVATLRDYLTCEYKIKMPEAPLHAFNKDNMPGHCVKVPQQNNFTDCGLYLLQYVEQFFKDPIRDYRVPIKQLANWFDTLTVTKKREDISNLIQTLMDERNGPNNKIILPEIPFPTLNGQLVEPDGYNIEFEEEDMEDDDDDDNQTADMDDISNEDMNKSKLPTKMGSMPATIATATPPTTMPTLVPTQGRKIVLKRRMQVTGGPNETSSSSPSMSSPNTSSCQTPPGQVVTPGQQQRPPNMTKIRKLEP